MRFYKAGTVCCWFLLCRAGLTPAASPTLSAGLLLVQALGYWRYGWGSGRALGQSCSQNAWSLHGLLYELIESEMFGGV